MNTDAAVLARFPLARVYEQLITLGGTSQTAVQVHQQMWDALDVTANAKFAGPHCDADNSQINGFPIDCPRPESVLKETQPEVFKPVALFNRFDLSPADGSNCGEYRIVYALDAAAAGQSGRDFIIFEGVLPNPQPRCGIAACQPVVQFWESLPNLDANTELPDSLERFYFTGLDGFEPIVHPQHYGAAGGQIRINLFLNFTNWQLREFHLGSSGGGLILDPVTVKANPFHELFNVASTDSRGPDFQREFPKQSSALAVDSVAQISLGTADAFNGGQSTAQDPTERYQFQLAQGNPPNSFSDGIEAELARIQRSDLTAENIATRATTQSCAGCHNLSNGAALGGKSNPTWPASRGFVHVDESGSLSPALWCSFLPARKAVLDGVAASPALTCDPTAPQRGPVVVVPTGAPGPTSAASGALDTSVLTIAGKIAGPN